MKFFCYCKFNDYLREYCNECNIKTAMYVICTPLSNDMSNPLFAILRISECLFLHGQRKCRFADVTR